MALTSIKISAKLRNALKAVASKNQEYEDVIAEMIELKKKESEAPTYTPSRAYSRSGAPHVDFDAKDVVVVLKVPAVYIADIERRLKDGFTTSQAILGCIDVYLRETPYVESEEEETE